MMCENTTDSIVISANALRERIEKLMKERDAILDENQNKIISLQRECKDAKKRFDAQIDCLRRLLEGKT